LERSPWDHAGVFDDRVAGALDLFQVGGHQLAALVQIFDVRAGFFQSQQDVVALDAGRRVRG
jgi:hypothetical protein